MADKESILGRSLGNGFEVEEVVKTVKAHYLQRAMKESHNNKTKASELLGLSGQKTLTNWLKRHDLE
jgi:DNA-binding protein Fis